MFSLLDSFLFKSSNKSKDTDYFYFFYIFNKKTIHKLTLHDFCNHEFNKYVKVTKLFTFFHKINFPSCIVFFLHFFINVYSDIVTLRN